MYEQVEWTSVLNRTGVMLGCQKHERYTGTKVSIAHSQGLLPFHSLARGCKFRCLLMALWRDAIRYITLVTVSLRESLALDQSNRVALLNHVC